MLQPWQTATIIKIEDATAHTRRFWLQVPSVEKFDFEPGQFVTFDLPISEKKTQRMRSYSIASWPDGTNVFELVIVQLEGGAGTRYLFEEVQVGSELKFRGPQGVFTLPAGLDRDVYLICTGTGIAPFRSMAHHIFNHHIPHQHIYLIFGTRTFNDALYREELEQLQQGIGSFTFIPVFSREVPGEGYATGYVHEAYEQLIERRKLFNPDTGLLENSPAFFFLCGWKNMIEEARHRIGQAGYDRKSVHLELYG